MCILEDTGYQYPIYADPTRKLYKALGLISSLTPPPADAPKSSYAGSVVSTTIQSTWVYSSALLWLLLALIPASQRALKSPFAFFKGGDITQLGGDFVLGPGELVLVSTLSHDASTILQGITALLRHECAGPPIVRLS